MPHPDPEPDEASWPVVKAVCAAIACFLAIAAICFVLADTPEEQEARQEPADGVLQLDLGNAAQMHAYGMPTAEDVMYWHLHGQWGYYEDGGLRAYADLPGRSERWDMLYGIDPSNQAFDK